MKKDLFVLLLTVVFCFIVVLLGGLSGNPKAATLGTRYFHGDTMNINTVGIDTVWASAWEYVTIFTPTIDCWYKVGAPDTSSWASRFWMWLPQNGAIAIGPSPKLKRLQIKSNSGTGVIYLIGYKKAAQY